MLNQFLNIFWLGTKELRTFARDFVLVALVVYSFTLSIYTKANSGTQEFHNATIAVVDEDHSPLSHDIEAALLPPQFKPPQIIPAAAVDRLMDTAQYTFVIDIPPHFERDVTAGQHPPMQVNVDATAMMQAGIGAGYLETIINRETARWLSRTDISAPSPVTLAVRVAFNPNLDTVLFDCVTEIINNVTLLAIVLAGAAVIREREHGTMDHLLTMPLSPFEIAAAKIWANGLVIALAVWLSLTVIVRTLLAVHIAGSVPLFMVGIVLYLFFTTAIGLFLGTIARSMPQLGLLFLLIALPMNILSGGHTPLSSMPSWLQVVMQASPSTQLVNFAQQILYRGAGIEVVWLEFLMVGVIGALFFLLALWRFRKITAVPIV